MIPSLAEMLETSRLQDVRPKGYNRKVERRGFIAPDSNGGLVDLTMKDILDVAIAQRIGGADGDLIESLCEERTRLRNKEAVAWKPIETVPKDGTKVLLWCRDAGCETAEWIVEKHEWWERTSDTTQELRKEDGGYWSRENGCDATHWMPLPEAPNA